MGQTYEIQADGLKLVTTIPLLAVTEIRAEIQENEHGKAFIRGLVREGRVQEVMDASFYGDQITVMNGAGNVLFSGLIGWMEFQVNNHVMEVTITCSGNTILLDRTRNKRSFQNPGMTYNQIISRILQTYGNVDFSWQVGNDKPIGSPIIQYEETDWEFLKRLASHFRTVLYADCESSDPSFHFGVKKGAAREGISLNIFGYGIGGTCNNEGGYGESQSREPAAYLKVKDGSNWEIGDTIFHEGVRYTVHRKKIIFEKGAAEYIYTLGADNFIGTAKYFNKGLAGIGLTGTIKKATQESVYLQLEIDTADGPEYPWDWAPETGNLSYCMPETGTSAVLYFFSEDEKDGTAVHTKRTNGDSNVYANVQNREIHTMHDKTIGLYPEKLFVEGKGKEISISLTDKDGISLKSNHSISLRAGQGIWVNGKSEVLSAPQKIVCRTSQSNIEINRDFNFYAPGGVKTRQVKDGLTPSPTAPRTRKKTQTDCWQMAYSAMAAVPAVDFAKGDSDGVVDLMAGGAVPKIANGQTVSAMTEVMEGKNEKDIRFPNALASMGLFTEKGGYLLPAPPEQITNGTDF